MNTKVYLALKFAKSKVFTVESARGDLSVIMETEPSGSSGSPDVVFFAAAPSLATRITSHPLLKASPSGRTPTELEKKVQLKFACNSTGFFNSCKCLLCKCLLRVLI